MHVILQGSKVAKWQGFQVPCGSMATLVSFYTTYISRNLVVHLSDDQTMCISGGKQNDTLCNIQEAVSGGVVLIKKQTHTLYAIQGIAAEQQQSKCIVVQSSDTGVLCLLLHHRHVIKFQCHIKLYSVAICECEHILITLMPPSLA